jgi:hypothetical protein
VSALGWQVPLLRWQAPRLTEVPLDLSQRMDLRLILSLNVPEEDGGLHSEFLPDHDILAALPATQVTLTPMKDRPCFGGQYALWFQLAKRDRCALQSVLIHDRLRIMLNRSIRREPDTTADWLRWIAVREAYRTEPLQGAFKTASHRLKDTPAKGQPATMKRAYDRVQHILVEDLSAGDW